MIASAPVPIVCTIVALTVGAQSVATGHTSGHHSHHDGQANQSCRLIPGDQGYPITSDWAQLNRTVSGKLVATVPVAHVCHNAGQFAAYNESACEQIASAVESAGPQTLDPVAGEILNPYWQNDTCSPFTSPSQPCELGNRPVYSINVEGPADVQAGLDFAAKNNIRLVVRNTGIDYQGKSSGQGALALWTYNLKSTNLIHNYTSSYYSGAALKLGSGVTSGEADEAVRGTGFRLVTAECGLVGMVGGYAQGGGQSQLVTAYGLAADQALEWEVVTPRGEHLVATPESNSDLYWALTGGGGGTFGIVLSATFRVFPEGPVAGGTMVVQSTNTSALFEAIEIFFSYAPSYVNNTRDNIQLFVTNDTLTVLNFVMPDQNTSSIPDLLQSFFVDLSRLGLTYNLTTAEYPTFLKSFIASYGPLPYGDLCPSYPTIGSRLIPREVVSDPTSNRRLIDLYRNITASGTWWIGCSILNVDDEPGTVRPPHPPNAVNPAWRKAIAYCNPQTHQAYNWTDPAVDAALRQTLVDDIFPRLEAATPGGGVLNEIEPTYKGNWKESFYGSNYDRLLSIKHKYDPNSILYGLFAVGSDEFVIDSQGRLCEKRTP